MIVYSQRAVPLLSSFLDTYTSIHGYTNAAIMHGQREFKSFHEDITITIAGPPDSTMLLSLTHV